MLIIPYSFIQVNNSVPRLVALFICGAHDVRRSDSWPIIHEQIVNIAASFAGAGI